VKVHDWGDVVAAGFLLAVIMLLVHPKSIAPSLVTAFGDGLTQIITFAVAG
jgi:hypothetical protein